MMVRGSKRRWCASTIRRDFSCAVFDGKGRMIEQAAHIPVHLGSMPLSVQEALSRNLNIGFSFGIILPG